ncbi:XrtA/PEP-CTERM system TPR-repeat protein PrsT [Thiohalobacter thiocyanaticus]|nr:XrtA/PEP-CTERM system TPR-repeat protein PrsT [Thiohalobacter thiocyanaticus]
MRFLLALLSACWLATAAAEVAPVGADYEAALSAYNNDDVQTAVILLKNILQKHPDNLSAHVLLGKAYLKTGDAAGAEKELRIADRLGADPSLTTVAWARALKQQREYQEALGLADPERFPAVVQAQLLVVHGHIHLETRQPEAARDVFADAVRLQPEAIEPVLGQALAELQLGQVEQARGYVARALELDDGAADVWQVRASIEYAAGALEQALKYYGRALEYVPGHLAARMGRAGVYIDLERYASAVKDLETLREQHPYDPRANYMLAVAHGRLGNASEAQQALADAGQVLNQMPREQLVSDGASLLLSGLVNFSRGAWEEAYRDLSETVKLYPDQTSARKLLARIHVQREEYTQAIDVLEPLIMSGAADYQSLTMLGTALVKTGRYDKAERYLEQAMAHDNEGAEARMQHALVSLATGRDEQAMANLQELLDNGGLASSAGMTLVVLHLRRNDPQAAIRLAQQLLQQDPDDKRLRNLLGAAQLAAGRFTDARATFNAILEHDPKYMPARINLGKLAVRKENYQQARSIFEDILRTDPEHTLTLIEMARLERAMGQSEAAIAWLRKAVAHDRRSIDGALELVGLYLSLGRADAATEVATAISDEMEDSLPVLQALVRSHLAQGSADLARVNLDRMSKLAGFDSGWMFRIAQLQLQAKDEAAAMFSLRKALAERPEFLRAGVMLTELYLQGGKYILAMEQAQALQQANPDSSEGYRLAGDIHHARGEVEAALASYRAGLVREEDPRLVVAQYRVLLAQDRLQAGVALLEDWLQRRPQASLVRFALADGLLRLGDHARAAAAYETLVADGFNPPLVLNNLANTYLELGDDRALATARRAHALDPDSAMLNDTLGWILVNRGQSGEALPYLRHAHARAAGNPEIRYHIAVALQQQGRNREARREFQAALAGAATFPGRDDARMRLQALDHAADS